MKRRKRRSRLLGVKHSNSKHGKRAPWEGFEEVALPVQLAGSWHASMANHTYGVLIWYGHSTPWGVFDQMMVSRLDGRKEHDWWVLQRIKDAIFGADREAFELYPAAERVRDKAHSYHLWVLEEGAQIPLGKLEGAAQPKGYPSASSCSHLTPEEEGAE